MDRIFRVDFYPHEWISLTGHLSPEQKGIFIDILALIYAHRGAIKNDPNHIGRVSNCSPRLARSIIEKLIAQDDLQEVGDGFITQKRCESELNKKRTHLESSANGGRKRNENRPQSNKNKDLTSSEAVFTPPSSSPSPSPSIETAKAVSVAPPEFTEKIKLQFNEFWIAWIPYEMTKGDKQQAYKSYLKSLKGTEHETLIRNSSKYLENCRNLRCKSKHAATWLNQQGWLNDDATGVVATRESSGHAGGYKNSKPTALELALADRTNR